MLKEKHEYFKMIKKRMQENNYTQYSERMKEEKAGAVYFLNNKRMSREQIKVLSVKVKEITSSNEFILDPLNKLILDYDEFIKLDDVEKQRYILDLSNIYIDIKKKSINN